MQKVEYEYGVVRLIAQCQIEWRDIILVWLKYPVMTIVRTLQPWIYTFLQVMNDLFFAFDLPSSFSIISIDLFDLCVSSP